jgi:putative SOS response-associated peptidase YedK
MCGRFALNERPGDLEPLFDAVEVPNLPPRFNIAPTDTIAVVRQRRDVGPGEPAHEFVAARWGLVPFWADSLDIGTKMINARAETITEKPAYREAIRRRRGVVPAAGFFEWRALGRGRRKQPMYIHRADGRPLLFAGLFERWQPRDGAGPAVVNPEAWSHGRLRSATIITTAANAMMRDLHDRMPAILPPDAVAEWLDPGTPAGDATAMLRPAPDDLLVAHPVSPRVNSPGIDDPALIEPVEPPPEPPTQRTLFDL